MDAARLATTALAGLWAFELAHNHIQKHQMLGVANKLASLSEKPVLNVGAGEWQYGDVRCDIEPHPGVEYCDAQDLSQYTDRQFSVCFLSHVLEHLENPDAALEEAWRVADNVVVILPSPLFLGAWLCPQHRWVYAGDLRWRINPLVNWAVLVGGLGLLWAWPRRGSL